MISTAAVKMRTPRSKLGREKRRAAGSGDFPIAASAAGAPAERVKVCAAQTVLCGILRLPQRASAVIIIVADSSGGEDGDLEGPENQHVAEALHQAGFGTLLLDLITREERHAAGVAFNVELLARRLVAATLWLENRMAHPRAGIGYFGVSTGSAAAFLAAAHLGSRIRAIVSRSGRPDLASAVLGRVRSPTMSIVGGYDSEIVSLNEEAHHKLHCTRDLRIIPCATHLFEEPGKRDQVAQLAAHWFCRYMRSAA